jgi:deoxyribonuclease V
VVIEIAAFDVHYLEDGRVSAAAVILSAYGDAEPIREFTALLPEAAGYIPGEFFRRELPAILALLQKFDRLPDEVLVDGYVTLGDRPGLGDHLFRTLGGRIPVIGVAKSRYRGASGIEVFRGRSARPLYITTAGIDSAAAAERIRRMHGANRIPTLLKRVDRLAREAATNS